MALRLESEILVDGKQVGKPLSVKIQSSWKQAGTSCTITLPNLKGQLERKLLKVGAEIEVRLGDGVPLAGQTNSLRTEFTGYIRQINPNRPLELICEDELYRLRRTAYYVDKKNVRLRQILGDASERFGIELSTDIPDVFFEKVYLDRNLAELLELFTRNGLVAYFRNRKLFVGLRFAETGMQTIKLDTSKNVFGTSLEYRNETDAVMYRAKVVGFGSGGNKVELEKPVGPASGTLITLTYIGVTDANRLRDLALDELARMTYEGYYGSVMIKGSTYCEHGWEVDFIDNFYPERAGKYRIDAVSTVFGERGFTREIELGAKLV
jgi:hypothetical protein